MQLLPVQRREAMYALYAFCREVGDIADGKASPSLKQALLLNWRSEIAHLFHCHTLAIAVELREVLGPSSFAQVGCRRLSVPSSSVP
jgi:phytoene/squalene synthetase